MKEQHYDPRPRGGLSEATWKIRLRLEQQWIDAGEGKPKPAPEQKQPVINKEDSDDNKK